MTDEPQAIKELKNEVMELDTKFNKEVKNDLINLFGMIETVSVAPTHIPIRLIDQIKLYRNGSTTRIYIYDTTNKTWAYIEHYVAP